MSVQIRPLALPGVLEIVPRRFGDDRGVFCETWSAESFREAGLDLDFVQDNHSVSTARGVVRGLHYQLPPHAQDKLVRVVRGAIFDVAVDIRSDSPSFGKWVGIELSADKWNQLLVPKGYAHGFQTLEPDTEVLYKVSNYYSPGHEISMLWNDPALAIDWPSGGSEPILSPRDEAGLRIAEIPPVFEYAGAMT